jgi:hypothetical protein
MCVVEDPNCMLKLDDQLFEIPPHVEALSEVDNLLGF